MSQLCGKREFVKTPEFILFPKSAGWLVGKNCGPPPLFGGLEVELLELIEPSVAVEKFLCGLLTRGRLLPLVLELSAVNGGFSILTDLNISGWLFDIDKDASCFDGGALLTASSQQLSTGTCWLCTFPSASASPPQKSPPENTPDSHSS